MLLLSLEGLDPGWLYRAEQPCCSFTMRPSPRCDGNRGLACSSSCSVCPNSPFVRYLSTTMPTCPLQPLLVHYTCPCALQPLLVHYNAHLSTTITTCALIRPFVHYNHYLSTTTTTCPLQSPLVHYNAHWFTAITTCPLQSLLVHNKAHVSTTANILGVTTQMQQQCSSDSGTDKGDDRP